MKYEGRRKSDNVVKQGSSGRRGGMPSGIGGLSGTGIILILVVSLLMGKNPLDLLGMAVDTQPTTTSSTEFVPRNEREKELVEMLSVVLADTEDVWHRLFKEKGLTYREPKLTIYQDTVDTACGFASSNMGPFYCGGDENVYIDVSFVNQLETTLDAKGDFPFAYVLAHEVGHHVQKLTGTLQEVQGLRGRVSDVEFNKQMVNLELQADYYAGVYTHYANKFGYLEPGDIEEGLRAASGVGDDRLQEMQGGRANPDTFQHGTSEQRSNWFNRGVKYGDFEHGNTFELVNN